MVIRTPFSHLTDLLREQGVAISDLPPEVLGHRLRPETWLEQDNEAVANRVASSLPAELSGARIDGTPVLFCILTGDPTYEGMRDNLRRLRNQATIARSWLDADAPDLQIFVTVPPDPPVASTWLEYAPLIEADDRICRKLFWLPKNDAGGETVEEFLSRTFLASPWEVGATSRSAELDSMSIIKLPDGWLPLVEDEDLESADDLIRALLELGES